MGFIDLGTEADRLAEVGAESDASRAAGFGSPTDLPGEGTGIREPEPAGLPSWALPAAAALLGVAFLIAIARS